jgi:hypothetical protein
MNAKNSSNSNLTGGEKYTYDLPPIRKIGPAVLPKPKNIKIQAGRGKQLYFFFIFSAY